MIEITPREFLELSPTTPVVDVRSPKEFATGHIPGAYNLPLFENDERSIVGILYKNKGRQEAIRKGLEIVGPKMTSLVDKAISLADNKEILVHCWRGGMRSSSVGWLFEASDLKVYILKDGYKNYRSHIRSNMLMNRELLVLGGLTGSGKTNILHALAKAGEPVIDLEGIANHRGSAFGGVGLYEQPSTEHFENLLFHEMQKIPEGSCVWIEDESRRIGDLFLPEYLHHALRKARVVCVKVSDNERKEVLLNEYSQYPASELIVSIEKLRKRVGGLVAQQAILFVEEGKFGDVIDLLLPYYDKLYNYGLSKRLSDTILEMDFIDFSLSARIKKLSDIRKQIQVEIFGI